MRKANYDKFPAVDIQGRAEAAWKGYVDIGEALKLKVESLRQSRVVVAVECYPGVLDKEVLGAFEQALRPAVVVKSREANYCNEYVSKMLERDLTDDRVRGFMNNYRMDEFFDDKKLAKLRATVRGVESGVVLVYGVGATLVCESDVIVYADMARWEIQLRYRRKEVANWCDDNFGEDFLRMYKRAFFVDWRVADRHKQLLFDKIDFLLDTNKIGEPKMLTGDAFIEGLKVTASRPFRVVPYFDAGPWGGQWMKEVCDLDKSSPNFAWCFDGVPEENSLLMNYGDIQIEVPSIDVVFYQAKELLGERVHARFGKEFPIRFDFLDTMKGGNLSLQVHPTTEYIQEQFGIHYTQDESYYMLDAGDDAVVYLGTKTGIDPQEMIADLERAETGEILFDAEKYVNVIPAKKHDHFLIPGGTVHCSGTNGMVLEISATPYIFTFKLWDWGRLGMDGKPRPIHVEHGKKVINFDWDTKEIMEKHVNCFETIAEGDGWIEERTGLHEREFIETRRHWFTKSVLHHTNGGVNVLNLVEGEEAIVESPTGAFEPFVIHFAETFIIPAAVGDYKISPYGKSVGQKCGTIKAFVRV